MPNGHNGSIYVDLDGTLAEYDGWKGPDVIGKPVEAMLNRVKSWLASGETVKLFTARASVPEQIPPVRAWLEEHGLSELEITCIKGFDGYEFWDDRAVAVQKNTGLFTTWRGADAVKSW